MGLVFALFISYIQHMWIKQIKKRNSPKGKTFYQYQLTQSARMDGKVKHISVLYLGSHFLLEKPENRKILARLLKDRINRQKPLENGPAELEALARQYYEKYLLKNQEHPRGPASPQGFTNYEPIALDSTQVEQARQIGAEWMLSQMVARMGLPQALSQCGLSKKQIDLALVALISRALATSSEHKTAQWLAQNSALCELFDFPEGFIPNRHHLYQAASRLYEHKNFLEPHLYNNTMELFGLQETLMIYDLTNTYFEGVKAGSRLARFGKSKEKRNDCKQVVLAAVVNRYGMLRYSRIYEGNMSDPKSLKDLITGLQEQQNTPFTLVMDAGIASEANLAMLRQNQWRYICVNHKTLLDYQAVVEQGTRIIYDKSNGPIELKIIHDQGDAERWVYVRSLAKVAKEHSMHQQAAERFEAELQQVQAGMTKKGGTKRYGKVMERIGRIKERYPGVHKYYRLHVEQDEKHIATHMQWVRKDQPDPAKGQGVYFLRTNYPGADEQQLWDIYNTIREVESAFRTLKTDLNLRPIYHQKDCYTEAHLFLGLLAYQLVAAIRYQLKNHGLHHDWSNIIRIMMSQKLVSIRQQAKTKTITLQLASNPIKEVSQIYDALGMKHFPFKRKKFVVYH